MSNSHFEIAEISAEDSDLIQSFIADNWGSSISVSRGRIFNTANLPGFIYKKDNKVVGLVTYNIDKEDCEIVTLNSQFINHGLATQLINKVVERAKISGCIRVWLITTNDNINALRFYQKRGFEWVGFFRNAMDDSRRLKPEIPKFGNDNIPIKHEIEFELRL